MAALRKHRDCLIASAVALFRRQGYAGTGLAEILSESGAPRGSLYHYFPEGKSEIAEVALREVGDRFAAMLESLAAASASPGQMVTDYGRQLATWLEQSGYRDGCPIATVMLEAAPRSAKLTGVGREVFAAWAGVLSRRLQRAGIAAERALELADFTIGTFEGALMLARVRQSTAPLLAAAGELARVFDREFKQGVA